MATDAAVLELLVRWFQIAVSTDEGTVEGVSQDEAQQIVDLVEAGEAGFKLGLRGRELVNAAMHAVRFDEIGVEASTTIVQQMIDERTDTETLNWLQTELDAGREIEMFVTPGRIPGTDGEKVVRTRLIYGSMSNHSNAIGVDLRSSLRTLRDFVEPSAPVQAPEA